MPGSINKISHVAEYAKERMKSSGGMSEDASGARESSREGLCARCAHARRIHSARGSEFLLCELSKIDPAFPKYPRLPVMSCAGYEPAKKG